MADYQSNSHSIFREVASKASIVEVISYELGANALVKAGKDYKCLCPFHNDHSPSMQINVERNIFKCYVDGNGGDPIKFVQLYEHISPFEALKKVCEICHIPLPDEIRNRKVVLPAIEIKFKNELAALKELGLFYQTYLSSPEGKKARDYLEKRKIPKDAIEHFQLGFAPSDPTLSIKALRKNGFDVPVLEKAGILSSSADLKDRFSNRLMYPIWDDYGHLVGFSGRKILDETPGGKYENSPSSDVFVKSEILYHYSQARNVASKYGYVYLVEGFNDVIAFHRAGIDSCVGTMGTALTSENAKSLKKLGVEIRLCLDRDEAGQEAMEKILPMLLSENVHFRVVRPFKGGKDADEVLANYGEKGVDELNAEINRFFDPFQFLLSRLIKKHGENNHVTDSVLISNFISYAHPYFDSLDPVSKLNDVRALSKVSLLSEEEINRLLSSSKPTVVKTETKTENVPTFPERTYRSRFNQTWKAKEEDVNIVKNVNLTASKQKFSSFAYDFVKETLNCVAAKGIEPNLLKNETEIMLALPHDCEAALRMESSGVDFVFPPFYYLRIWIHNIFISNPGMKSFNDAEYQQLLDHLDAYATRKDEDDEVADTDAEEEDFDFDVDDDGDDKETKKTSSFDSIFSLKINPDDIAFMKRAIQYISTMNDSVYSDDNFESLLKAHKLLEKYIRREEYCRKQNLSLISDSELMSLQFEMKNYGISFSKNLKKRFS